MARDISQCHPELQQKAAQLVARCAEQGLIVMITDCMRDRAEQEACVAAGTSGCHYPNSHHNWGTAFDICRNDGAGAYNDSDGWFERVGAIGQAIGLEWGGAWISPVDRPHFQLPNWGTGTSGLINTYGNPDAFRATWTPAEQTKAKKEGIDMQCFFYRDGEPLKWFDGQHIHPLAHPDEKEILNTIYKLNNDKDMPEIHISPSAPYDTRLRDAVNRVSD